MDFFLIVKVPKILTCYIFPHRLYSFFPIDTVLSVSITVELNFDSSLFARNLYSLEVQPLFFYSSMLRCIYILHAEFSEGQSVVIRIQRILSRFTEGVDYTKRRGSLAFL